MFLWVNKYHNFVFLIFSSIVLQVTFIRQPVYFLILEIVLLKLLQRMRNKNIKDKSKTKGEWPLYIQVKKNTQFKIKVKRK